MRKTARNGVREYTSGLSENGLAGRRTDIFLIFASKQCRLHGQGRGNISHTGSDGRSNMGNDFRFDEAVAGPEGMTPAEIMFYRFLIAYLALKLYKPTFRLPESWRDEALFAAAGLTGGSLYFLTENMALQITLASNVALLLATAPILTVLLSRLWLGRSEQIGRPLAARIGSGARRCRARRLQRELHSEDTACGRSAHAGCPH